MENLILSVDLKACWARVWAKSDLQMHSVVRKPNYPKVGKKRRKNNPATVVLAQPPQIKMWSTEWHVWGRQRQPCPRAARHWTTAECITGRDCWVFMKAPPMSTGAGVGRAGCVESLQHSHVCPSDSATGLSTHCISLSSCKPSVAMAVTAWSLPFLGIQLLNHIKSD